MDSESRALARTAAILLAVSLVRWGWTAWRPDPHLGGRASVVALLDSSRAQGARAAERSKPLAPGERLDPNVATEAQLDRLPGVGPTTAAEIVRERMNGGPYASVEDLARVRGLGPATVDKIRPHVALAWGAGRPGAERGRTPARRVDINRAGAEELTGLPGVGPALAARIVEARGRKRFASVDDLTRVRGIGPATVERLRALAVVR